MSDLASLVAAARRWCELDPQHAPELLARIAAQDEAWLRESFGATLDFGTGGMRGAMGPGTNRMNRPMIRRVTAALAQVLEADDPDAPQKGVVVGYDARHNSRTFAEDVAAVLVARGFRVFLADRVMPTPIVSYAPPVLGAAAGVIVTASHNPREDNGYKVFGATGAQIVAPLDERVRAAMDRVEEPVPVTGGAGALLPWPEDLLEGYARRVLAERVHAARPLRIVYTPVHGVGGELALRLLALAGYTDVHVVSEQIAPDGDFPTVSFPNPEEPGVLDLAVARAKALGADLVLANDPDADRLAVAVPDGAGGWRQLTGNELGVLFADDLLTHGAPGPNDLVATTIVSTAMLQRIGAAHGVRVEETLTGFKWIAVAGLAHEARGGRFRFGFEESIGYTVGNAVRDKDGIAAAVLAADLTAHALATGTDLPGLLDGLAARHGLHHGKAVSVRAPGLEGLARIREAMQSLRRDLPTSLGGQEVLVVRDLASGEGRRAGGERFPLGLPASDVVGFDLAHGRALVRPSGTEPKIKLYVEVVEPLAEGAKARAEAAALAIVGELRERLGM